MRQTLKKREILRGRDAFRDLFQTGRGAHGKLLRCYYLTGQSMQQPCAASVITAGFAVSRKLRRAVDRNRVRRLMRESFRTHKGPVLARFEQASRSATIVFLYTPSPGRPLLPSYHDVADDMQAILARITEREFS